MYSGCHIWKAHHSPFCYLPPYCFPNSRLRQKGGWEILTQRNFLWPLSTPHCFQILVEAREPEGRSLVTDGFIFEKRPSKLIVLSPFFLFLEISKLSSTYFTHSRWRQFSLQWGSKLINVSLVLLSLPSVISLLNSRPRKGMTKWAGKLFAHSGWRLSIIVIRTPIQLTFCSWQDKTGIIKDWVENSQWPRVQRRAITLSTIPLTPKILEVSQAEYLSISSSLVSSVINFTISIWCSDIDGKIFTQELGPQMKSPTYVWPLDFPNQRPRAHIVAIDWGFGPPIHRPLICPWSKNTVDFMKQWFIFHTIHHTPVYLSGV